MGGHRKESGRVAEGSFSHFSSQAAADKTERMGYLYTHILSLFLWKRVSYLLDSAADDSCAFANVCVLSLPPFQPIRHTSNAQSVSLFSLSECHFLSFLHACVLHLSKLYVAWPLPHLQPSYSRSVADKRCHVSPISDIWYVLKK